MIGHSAFDFVSGIETAFLLGELKTSDSSKTKKLSGSEYLIKKKDGHDFPLEMAISLLNNDKGRPKGIIAIGRDISKRKQAEEQLRFLGSITENTSEAIVVTDANFIITYINKVGEQFFGYSLNELKGKTPRIFNVEARAEQIQQDLYKIVASGKTYLGESLNRRKDGSTFYCEYKVMPLKDSEGRIYAYSSVQRDISERKRSEEVLRQSEDTFRRTFEAIPDPAYVWSRQDDGRLLLSKYNQAAEGITKGKIRDFLGIEAEKLFGDHPDFVTKIRQAMDKGERQFSEALYKYKSTDESKWLQVDYVKTAEKNVMVITKDISERKEAEAKLLAYQEHLRALTSEMMLVEERERRRIASELHDQIGQNLALCKLKVAALEKAMPQEDCKGELSALSRLLECSIQDARSLIFDLSPPVLYELGFQAALEWLAERIQEQYHIPVEFECRADAEPLENDRQVILFQVVRELLVNVGKHSRASQAKIILSHEGSALKIQVNDDGVGFDASRIYDAKEQKDHFGFFSIARALELSRRPAGGQIQARAGFADHPDGSASGRRGRAWEGEIHERKNPDCRRSQDHARRSAPTAGKGSRHGRHRRSQGRL